MIIFQLYNAIANRLALNANLFPSGQTPLLNGVFDNFAGSGLNFPFVVVDFADDFEDDAFALNQSEVTVRLNLFTSTWPSSSQPSGNIMQFIYGQPDASDGYGMHRWVPGASDFGTSPWRAEGGFYRTRGYTNHTENAYHWIDEYRIRCYNAA